MMTRRLTEAMERARPLRILHLTLASKKQENDSEL